jgi:hypothetical protein
VQRGEALVCVGADAGPVAVCEVFQEAASGVEGSAFAKSGDVADLVAGQGGEKRAELGRNHRGAGQPLHQQTT